MCVSSSSRRWRTLADTGGAGWVGEAREVTALGSQWPGTWPGTWGRARWRQTLFSRGIFPYLAPGNFHVVPRRAPSGLSPRTGEVPRAPSGSSRLFPGGSARVRRALLGGVFRIVRVEGFPAFFWSLSCRSILRVIEKFPAEG